MKEEEYTIYEDDTLFRKHITIIIDRIADNLERLNKKFEEFIEEQEIEDENEEPPKKHSKIYCPECNSEKIYIRLTTDEVVCRECACISKLN